MRRNKIIITLLIIVVLTGITLLIHRMLVNARQVPVARVMEETRLFVRAKKVVYESNFTSISGMGRLSSLQEVDLSVEVQGQILTGDILLKPGTRFKKGDLLFRIYDEEARNNLMASKSRFLNSIAGILPDIRIDYPDELDKWTQFFNSIDIQKELPALPDFESVQEKIFLSSRNILNDYYSILSSQIRLSKYRVTAPFSGSLTQVFMEVGSVANPGNRIATMIRTDQLELEVPLSAYDIYWIERGDKVTVTTEAGDHVWQGTVTRISDFVDPRSQSIVVFLNIMPSSAHPLFQGQYLRASFEPKPVEGSFEVPRNSVFEKTKVYTIVEGRLKKEEVRILKIGQVSTLIAGLDEGVYVVAEPLVNVREGALAEIINP